MAIDMQKVEEKKQRAKPPFNQVDYTTVCPQGHTMELWTGYAVFAPDWWKQHGRCESCQKVYHRTVEMVAPNKFVYGPLEEGIH